MSDFIRYHDGSYNVLINRNKITSITFSATEAKSYSVGETYYICKVVTDSLSKHETLPLAFPTLELLYEFISHVVGKNINSMVSVQGGNTPAKQKLALIQD